MALAVDLVSSCHLGYNSLGGGHEISMLVDLDSKPTTASLISGSLGFAPNVGTTAFTHSSTHEVEQMTGIDSDNTVAELTVEDCIIPPSEN